MSTRVTTEEFERYKPIDEQMDFHEKLRLLYVALTRARDHLVVSVHRTDRKLDANERQKWTHAELLWEAAHDPPYCTELTPLPPTRRRSRRCGPAWVPYPAWDDWLAQRAGVLETVPPRGCGRPPPSPPPRPSSPPRADPGLAKDARDLELPPWNKGRYGTAVGSAVHAVLQTVDLVTGDDIDETAAAQAAAEGVIGREHDIAALAPSVLASHTVREAVATDDYRREMYVATRVEGHTLEGYVDLVYRTAEGLVVVDYKTDAWRDDPISTPRSPATGSRARSYALASKRPRASASPAACSCSSVPAAPTNVRSATFRRLSRRYEHFSRRPPDPNEHEHAADRSREDHQRGVAPGPADVGADDHGHRDERQPHQAVDESGQRLARDARRDDPEVEEHAVRDALEQRHHRERFRLPLELATRVFDEVGHGSDGTLWTCERDHQPLPRPHHRGAR